MKTFRALLVALACATLCGCPSPQSTSLARPEPIQVPGSYTHTPSGMIFPPTVGAFQRVALSRYDSQGLDVSAGYNLPAFAGGIAATVYVYPAPSLVSIGSPPGVVASARATLCQSEFERGKREVLGAHAGGRLLGEKDVVLLQGGTNFSGRAATFEYDGLFAGQHQPVSSELYVFCYIGGSWTIKYRFTYARTFDATEAISAFMRTLSWTIAVRS